MFFSNCWKIDRKEAQYDNPASEKLQILIYLDFYRDLLSSPNQLDLKGHYDHFNGQVNL